ncbi:hypothetical protein [Sulfitobacter pontiacus]|uniref:hypothetical protein n=1 Tax=Sulfitobacter pontiacus TaxID=60137 RepID=UPI00045359D7|nr:hypothetical protein [Sulfitobacter pontiacus]KAJ31408.1 hypothetical protein PM01_05650 [Sulfitobacter pontiacus 3SOLIMAR09]
MTSMFLKNAATSVATVFIATSAFALDVGVGASVGGIGAGVGASVGHGSAADVGVGVGAGSVGAGAGASVGGGSVADAGAGASVGGVGAGVGASVGGDSVAGVGVGVGSTGGFNSGGGTTTDSTTAAVSRSVSGDVSRAAASVPITAALGATVMTTDREVVGMIEDVRPSSQGKFVATIRMNVAFGAQPRTIQIKMPMLKSDTDMIRVGFTKSGLLRQIQS